ncbi:MAG: DUF2752 domain-containing protein [Candidatus Kryptoniota bacterium]
MSKKKLYIFFFSLSLIGYVWVACNVFEHSTHDSLPTFCLFKEVTGIPCPSCGTTRSLIALISGNIKESLLINPFGPMMALALIIIPPWIAVDTLRRSGSFYRCYGWIERLLATNKWISIPAIMVVALNWVWNIVKGL